MASSLDRLTPTQQQILAILKQAGERLTTDQIQAHREIINGEASLSSTKQNLAELVRHALLTNRQDIRPRGYGLPEWS